MLSVKHNVGERSKDLGITTAMLVIDLDNAGAYGSDNYLGFLPLLGQKDFI